MQPAPPPQSAPPPQQHGVQGRGGSGRFWLGVLAGGCGVIAVEVISLLVVLFVVGATIGSAIRGGANGLPGLPALPSGLPNVSAHSDPCSPQPCLAHGGVTLLVANVNHNAGPAADDTGHLVALDVTFVGTAGTHTVTPQEIAVRDPSGAMLLPGMDSSAAQCGGAPVSSDLQAGQRLGPYRVCYAVGGAANAPLALVWISPEDLSMLELKLP
jgi:hypothetical protein